MARTKAPIGVVHPPVLPGIDPVGALPGAHGVSRSQPRGLRPVGRLLLLGVGVVLAVAILILYGLITLPAP